MSSKRTILALPQFWEVFAHPCSRHAPPATLTLVRRVPALLVLLVLVTPLASLGQQANFPALASVTSGAQDPLWGVGFDEALAAPAGLAQTLSFDSSERWLHPIHVRLIATRAELEPAPGRYDFAALDARLAQYRGLTGVDVYLDIRAAPPPPEAVDDWMRFLRELIAHAGSVSRGYIIGGDASSGTQPEASAYAFFLKTTAIELRLNDAGAPVILGGIADSMAAWLEALYDEDVGPYIDAVALEPVGSIDDVVAIIDRRDPGCSVVMLGVSLGNSTARAAERFVDRHLDLLGTRVTGVTYAGTPLIVDATLGSIAFLRDLIDQPLAALDDVSVGLSLTPLDGGAATPVRHRLLFGLESAATYLAYYSTGQPLELTVSEPTGVRPVIRDPVRRTRRPPDAFAFDTDARRAAVRLPSEDWPLIVDWSLEDGPTLVSRTSVSSSVLPSVAEIIARHQQAQASQDTLVSAYVADATMMLHFRPNVADPGFDVVTENRFFVQGRQTELEERSFQLNGTHWGSDRPPFPLIQAEKVLSLPLDLRLTSDYRYMLEGVTEVDGRECFVVRFDPVRNDVALYAGTVWIDRQTYLRIKAHTVQTRLGAPVLSSEETQRFTLVGTLGGRDVYLLTDLVGHQNVLIAGRSLMVERSVTLRNFRLNPANFEAERQVARASDHVMYRETDRGLRYLVKRDGVRVVDDQTTSAKAMLLGVTIDPGYDFPLPLGGINYLDFEFLGPDSQLAVLFGGVLALVNIQRPQLIGDSVDGSFDLFAIAVPGSDRNLRRAG